MVIFDRQPQNIFFSFSFFRRHQIFIKLMILDNLHSTFSTRRRSPVTPTGFSSHSAWRLAKAKPKPLSGPCLQPGSSGRCLDRAFCWILGQSGFTLSVTSVWREFTLGTLQVRFCGLIPKKRVAAPWIIGQWDGKLSFMSLIDWRRTHLWLWNQSQSSWSFRILLTIEDIARGNPDFFASMGLRMNLRNRNAESLDVILGRTRASIFALGAGFILLQVNFHMLCYDATTGKAWKLKRRLWGYKCSTRPFAYVNSLLKLKVPLLSGSWLRFWVIYHRHFLFSFLLIDNNGCVSFCNASDWFAVQFILFFLIIFFTF